VLNSRRFFIIFDEVLLCRTVGTGTSFKGLEEKTQEEAQEI
jgi:hypothetical protein